MLTVLGVVNAVTTPFFPWVVFPAVGFAVSLANRLGGLWADGVGLRDVFGRRRTAAPNRAHGPLMFPGEHLPRVATQAERTRLEMAGLVARLAPTDRGMIPDVMPTVDRLVERIRLLSVTIARMDAAVDPGAAMALDARIARAETSEHPDSRSLSLLRRQRESLQDLVERRSALRAQLDGASLALENLRLQLVKLGSAGVQSALENVTSATQEARALAREIGHVLDAAQELRSLNRGDHDAG